MLGFADAQAGSLLRLRLPAAVVVAAVVWSGNAVAADGKAKRLAQALEKSMAAAYKHRVPGLVFTRVSCLLPSKAKTGHCTAHFTISARRLVGVYTVTANVDPKARGARWRVTSVSCTDSKTRAKVPC